MQDIDGDIEQELERVESFRELPLDHPIMRSIGHGGEPHAVAP